MPDFPSFINSPPDSSLLYTGNYDAVLVLLSVAVAIFSAYAALRVSQHIASAKQRTAARRVWVVIGGLCLGLGIWAMHFVGMLAFSLPCTTSYDSRLTLLSMAPGIVACTLALGLISRPALSLPHMLMTGMLLGLGIGTMHYVGMAALRLEGLVRYDRALFLLSLALAILLATLAIWVKFRMQRLPGPWQRRSPLISATVLGLAAAGMHYTAMAAAYFFRDGDAAMPDSYLAPPQLAALVLTSTGIITLMTLLISRIARPALLPARPCSKIVCALIVSWCAASWFGVDRYHAALIGELYQEELAETNNRIEILVRNLDDTLRAIKGIPQVFSGHEGIRRALQSFSVQATPSVHPHKERQRRWTADPKLAALNQELLTIANHLPVDVIWVINKAGDTIAASNSGQADSFVGTNYNSRQYFQQAKHGHRGQQYAVGMVSKIPGLFYSYPVFENGEFSGAVVVKRNISVFADWINQVNAFATDANGVIVLAADKALESRTLPDAPVSNLSEQELRRQYTPSTALNKPLRITPWNDHILPWAVRVDEAPTPSLLLSETLPDGMLSVHIHHELHEVGRLYAQKNWIFLLLASAGTLLIIATSIVVLYLRQLRAAHADLRIAATAFDAQEPMMITDSKGVILRVNRAFSASSGYTAAEIVGQTPQLLQSGRHDPAFYKTMWEELNRTGTWQGEVWDRRKNGEVYPQWLTITAVKEADGHATHYVGVHTDITQRKAAEEEIRNLAFYDSLTHLPNRRLLLDRLQQALIASTRSSQQGALLFIDLDHFKTLNDTRGHDVGDLLLQQVAQRLLACVREQDTVARLGGDEFVVMLENLSDNAEGAAAHAQVVGEKIINALNQPFRLIRHEHHTTPSIGIALFSGHDDTVDDLLRRADLAMYQSKAAGRNTLRFFDPVMQTIVTVRATLETDFRDSLRHEDLLLHYQGQVDHRGQLIGAEALVRWQHPQRGMVSPAEFIPMAEETGLILPLGQWVLDAACKQLVRWAQHPQTAHLTLAVNVSARQFRHADFVAGILAVLDHTGADPKRLKLELTESILLDDAQDAIVKMTELKRHGVGFSLDDFGTGYSSLSYLKRLPLDQLKIDQSFVRDVFTDVNDAAIVRTIVALAQSLGLAVIAEGVETLAQRDFLAEQGCLTYQGYLFSRPGPVEALFAPVMAPATPA